MVAAVVAAGCSASHANRASLDRPGPGTAVFATASRPTSLTPADLAFGRPTGDRAVDSKVDLRPFLKPEALHARRDAAPRPAAPTPPQQPRKPEPARPTAPAVPESQIARAQVREVETSAAPENQLALASPKSDPLSDAHLYAEREATASEQMNYRGGDVVVISVSTLLVVLLVVVLILLLT